MSKTSIFFKSSKDYVDNKTYNLIDKIIPHLAELKNYKKYLYIFLDGGRNSGKTYSVMLLFFHDILNKQKVNGRYTVIRKTATSSVETVFADFEKCATNEKIYHLFDFNEKTLEITHKKSKSTIYFRGYNDYKALMAIKGLTENEIVWSEESQTLLPQELQVISKSIIRFDTLFIFTYNRHVPADEVNQYYQRLKNLPEVYYNYSNYLFNPYCSERFKAEAELCKRFNPAEYDHDYLGLCGGNYMAFSQLDKCVFVDDGLRYDNYNWFISMDWGYSDNTVVGWYCKPNGNYLLKFDELVVNNMTPDIVAKNIHMKNANYRPDTFQFAVADPSIYNKTAYGMSVGDTFYNNGIPFIKGANHRQSGYLKVKEMVDKELLGISNKCTYTIETMSSLVMSTSLGKINDIDQTVGEDHAYDETRYACMTQQI